MAVVVLAAAFAGYHQIFTTHSPQDDEGYVMLSLVSFMEGRPLYDETYTQYGPAPFVVRSALHRLGGLPVTHDVTRLTTLAVWLGAATLGAALVVRVTGARTLWVPTFLIVFFHLERLCLEPGHPQELCVLALVAAPLVLACGLRAAWQVTLLGLFVATVLATKINVGVFLLATCALMMLLLGPRDRLARLALAASVPAVLVMPFLVCRAHLRAPSGTFLPFVVASSTLATVVVALRETRPAKFAPRDLATFLAVVLIGTAGWLLVPVGQGTSWNGLRHGLLGVHAGFAQHFSEAPPLHPMAIPWGVFGVLAALASQRRAWIVAAARGVGVLALAIACLYYLLETCIPLVHGTIDRGAAGTLVGMALPMIWVLAKPADRRGSSDVMEAPRLFLALLACLQPLGAYPTPGTQMAVGSLPVVLGCVIVLHDGIRAAGAWRAGTWLVAAVSLLLVSTVGLRDIQFRRRWSSLASLGLPGAHRIRLPSELTTRFRWLTRTLREHTDTFVFAEHAHDSFYLWTERPPPTGLNPPSWPFMLDRAEQERVVAALRSAGRVGVVHEPFALRLPDDSPLRAYIAAHFEPALGDGFFEVWLPKGSSRR
jgi:hypothetical protein